MTSLYQLACSKTQLDFPTGMIKFDHRVGQHLKNKLLLARWQITSIKTTTLFFRREYWSVTFSFVWGCQAPPNFPQCCSAVCLVRGLGSGVVWHWHSGRMNCWQTRAVFVLAAVRVSWNSTTWCEASFAPLTCELLNETKRKKRFVILCHHLERDSVAELYSWILQQLPSLCCCIQYRIGSISKKEIPM